MSAVHTAGPLVAYADLEGDLWGIVIGGEQPQAAVARLTGADIELRPAELDLDDDEVWLVTAPGCALRVERADASSATAEGEGALEPCRVSGSATIDAAELEFDVGGVRAATLSADGGDSLRLFAAWFAAGHELALLAARPKGAKGQDQDSLEAVTRGEEHPLVIDPRLSTTYDKAGAPLRVGLELWLGEDPDGELSPRRVAGLATGSQVATDGLSAHAFECVSRGEPGAGMYLLLQP
jgi:hypothetical protein